MAALLRRLGAVVAVTAVLVVALVAPAMAHPLGNFTSNAAIRVVFGQDATQIRYILDLAEIPTVQARQRLDVNDDGDVTDDEADDFASQRCAETGPLLTVEIDGVTEDITLTPVSIDFPEGQAGLLTTRLVCEGQTVGIDGPSDVVIRDDNGLDRVGWREITLTGDRVVIQSSDAPEQSTTQLLRMYPQGSLDAPARQVTASASVAPGGPAAAADVLDPAGLDDGSPTVAADQGFFERMTTSYTELIARQEMTPGFILLAVGLAVLLGAAHAVAPGHGKTVMAAYVVGERGSTRQALAIGATVAMTHTVGTLLLGVAIRLSEGLAAEELYPYFGLFSGLLIISIGVGLLRSALRRRGPDHDDHDGHEHGDHDGHDHDDHDGHEHGDHDDHDHGDHDGHDHGDAHDHDSALAMAEPGTIIRHHGHTHVIPDADMSWRQLIALGVAGGLAPSPSALLVLLGAIALGRTALGVGLVAAYGLGLALVLVGGGLLLVRFRKVGERILARGDNSRLGTFTRVLPIVTGLAVIAGGLVVAVRGFLLA